ncbi:MAG: fibronectin type III-like domain-contianing protein, partial [Acidobacteria bacterium]|nr:fibronectin type III-like domain-contianing protein [Acidobacteriota bacterium]
TSFEYSNLSFDKASITSDSDLKVRVDVKNAGQMAGDEVVQVYLSRAGIEGAPLRALAGFQRVHLAAGASRKLEITIPNRQLSVVDNQGARKIVPGKVQLWVGGGPPMVREALVKPAGLSGSVEITGEATLSK